jgi:hypothetical protein
MSSQNTESLLLSTFVSIVHLDSDNPNQNCTYLCFVLHNALLVAKWAMETKYAIASGVRCAFVKRKLLALSLVAH